jgi:hypothetical protein
MGSPSWKLLLLLLLLLLAFLLASVGANFEPGTLYLEQQHLPLTQRDTSPCAGWKQHGGLR